MVYGIQVMDYIYIGMGMGYRLGYGLDLSCLYGVQWDGWFMGGLWDTGYVLHLYRDGYGLQARLWTAFILFIWSAMGWV